MSPKTTLEAKKVASFVSLKKNCLSLFLKLIKINRIYSKHCTRNVESELFDNYLILRNLKKTLQRIVSPGELIPLKNIFTESLDIYLKFVERNFVNNNIGNLKRIRIYLESRKIIDSLGLETCDDICLHGKVHCLKVREVLRSVVQELQRSNDTFFDNLNAHNKK
jgi:hypothetical protein